MAETPTARLLISCTDRPGLIAAVSGFLAEEQLNITDADQHSSEGRFFMRMVFEAPSPDRRDEIYARFADQVASPLGIEYRFTDSARRPRMAVMVSREGHCLAELLWRRREGELAAELSAVISTHADHEDEVASLGVPFHRIPWDRDEAAKAEAAALELLVGVELLILARFMRVLSADFLDRLGAPAINIHHSFLPAFVGADPYRRAHERGVKLIGATAHYVTEELDAGPIIAQDVAPVSHRDEVAEMVRIGRDVERRVLARAVSAHLDDRVLLDGSRTVVFESRR